MPKLRDILYSLNTSIRRWVDQTGLIKIPSRPEVRPTSPPRPSRPPESELLPPFVREAKLNELAAVPNWEWPRFRDILVLLALIGKGQYLPAVRLPDSICLDGLQTTILELQAISRQRQGRETSRVIFADRGRLGLVISGKTHVGTQSTTRMIMTPEPGRENYQIPVLTVHIHPDVLTAAGFSDMDYVAFLSDFLLIGMVMRFKQGVFLALKTSATRPRMEPGYPNHMITEACKEFLESYRMAINPRQAVTDFNKTICLEFGLTLYQTFDLWGNLAQRVTVASV